MFSSLESGEFVTASTNSLLLCGDKWYCVASNIKSQKVIHLLSSPGTTFLENPTTT